jgi:hypothetical protein
LAGADDVAEYEAVCAAARLLAEEPAAPLPDASAWNLKPGTELAVVRASTIAGAAWGDFAARTAAAAEASLDGAVPDPAEVGTVPSVGVFAVASRSVVAVLKTAP